MLKISMQLVLRKPSYKPLNLDVDGWRDGWTNAVSSWGAPALQGRLKTFFLYSEYVL